MGSPQVVADSPRPAIDAPGKHQPVSTGWIKWRVRQFAPTDTDAVCRWISNRRLLQLVSSDDADSLTPVILGSWTGRALLSIVIADHTTDEPRGFCTITADEVHQSPAGFVELCHLLVDPRYRYLFVGPRICQAGKLAAQRLGFNELYGRVVSQHRFGMVLARRERFVELVPAPDWLPAGFRWYRHSLLR